MKKLYTYSSLIILIHLYSCNKYADNRSPLQKLLINKPWVLQYTDSIHVDDNSIAHYYRIYSTSCAKQESKTYVEPYNYLVKIVCGQPTPLAMTGQWSLDKDSTLFYELDTDSIPQYSQLLTASFIKEISQDTLKVVEYHTKDTSIYHYPIYVTDTYSH